MKALKIWNGRGIRCQFKNENGEYITPEHIYVCAYSRADAIRLINDFIGRNSMNDAEMKDYFAPCWGTAMKDVKIERGIWIQESRFSEIKRVV